MNKIAGMIYAIFIAVSMTVISKLLSNLFSFDIYILLFVNVLIMLALIWYKINVDNEENKND